jgi:hypothetical protein
MNDTLWGTGTLGLLAAALIAACGAPDPNDPAGGSDDTAGEGWSDDSASDEETDTAAAGNCCPDGNCLCHGPDPIGLTSLSGSYRTASFRGANGTVFYPTNAEAPFAGVALCGG